MENIIFTNNPLVVEKFKHLNLFYLENKQLLDVLIAVRDKVHNGAKLLTHPLTGSIKPDETPFKSIIVNIDCNNKLDLNSLEMISNSIEVVEKFLKGKNKKIYTEGILKDFQIIDLAIITSGIESMGGQNGKYL